MKRLSCVLALVAGCAGSAPFKPQFPNGGPQLKDALERAHAGASHGQSSIVLGVSDAPRAVFAYDIDAGKLLFREAAQVNALPSIAGELAVVPEATRITVRRLRDGSVVKELPLDGMHLVGADGDGTIAAVVLSTGGSINTHSRLVIFEGEKVRSDRTTTRALGSPAVLGGLAFVPHQRVHLSAIDPDGKELARARIGDDVASHAFRHQGEVYFGEHGFYRLDEASERGPAQGAHYWKLAPALKLPGAPPLFMDSNAPPPPIESALYRVALSALPGPTPQGALGLADDALYLAFYKQLYSLTADAASAHWVYETDSDVVGIRSVPGGLLALNADGVLVALDTQGLPTHQAQLALKPIAARIRAERLPGASTGEAEPLTARLDKAARNPDTRLVPSRGFAAQLLRPIEDDEAARLLIKLCTDVESPPRVSEQACASLGERTFASQAVLDALAQHPSYLDRTPVPPVGALASAALHAKDTRAVPLLGAQLFEPALPIEQVPQIFHALAGLGDPSAAIPLASFVRLYHADAGDDQFERVLVAGMDALIQLDPSRARQVLASLSTDQQGRGGVRVAAEQRLAKLGPEPGEEAAPTAAAPATPSDGTPPAHLTSQHVDEALSPVRPKLARCVRDAPEHPASARLTLVIDGDGKVAEVRALPESTQACARPLIEAVQFPATKYGKRTIMSYSVSR
ncbi:MAG TPA: hypothetical protein VFX59_08640 [Polyangiales bacterium]|nr:hypothetical protein [Polyangiales bacterium]